MIASFGTYAALGRGARAPLPDSELIRRIDERLPRYTSYPTAPHFHAGIHSDHYAAWLGALDAGTPISIYLHVPFCEQLCHYCGCHTTVSRRSDRVAHYATLLLRELQLVSETIGRRQIVTHVHWGGGTPSVLAASDFVAISNRLHERFAVSCAAEIAVEIDPRHLEADHIAAFAEVGLTRASLGVQDFNPTVQRASGRIQSFEQTARAVELLRHIGVSGISFDLMYGLPHQTSQSVADSVATALSLSPSRVSLFGYAHLPWMKKHQELIPLAALPDTAARLAQVRAAEAELAAAGYVAIGLDHFARADDPLTKALRAGRLRRNFQGYTSDNAPALLGIGASSIGFLPQGYVQNSPNLKTYREAIERGRLATARGFFLSDEDRRRRCIIERVMCDLSLDLADYAQDPKVEFANELTRLERLADDGLLTVEGTKLLVPQLMRPFVRQVASVFDTYFQNRTAQHSRAV
jgi:oxygen-independent coproporphyrinogen-3 oxidase